MKSLSLKEQIPNLMTMGLDLSLSSTGLVVWNGQKVKSFCLKKTTTKSPTEERISDIERTVMLGVRKYRPSLVVIEGHAYNSHGGSSNALHELHGVVKQALWKSESAFCLVPPPRLKSQATGNGRASKDEMIEAAEIFWPRLRTISGKRDDLADALHLAKYGYENFDQLVELG